MRNNIASFEKTSRSRVKIMRKINAEFIFAFNFAQNITYLLLVFSEEAILFLIYLLADKAKCVYYLCIEESGKSTAIAFYFISYCIK